MLTELILKKTVPGYREGMKRPVRSRIGQLEAWVSMIVNILLAVVKLALSLAIHSLALMADAFHTFSDVATSAVVLFGFKIAGKPADKEHPFGHGRAEYVATLIIAVMLGVVGFEFIKSSVGRLIDPVPVTASWGVLAIICLTIVIKLWLGKFSMDLGRRIQSTSLKADAWHHRSDAYSSILVLAAIWGSAGYPALDGAGGVLVGIYLLYSGIAIARQVIDPLMGEPPSPDLVHRIRELCRAREQVFDAHDITVHNYGHDQFITLHVEVSSLLSAQEAHDVAEDLSQVLRSQLGAYSTVHVDPIEQDSAAVHEVSELLDRLLPESNVFTGYHDLRVISTPQHEAILVDLDIDPDTSESEQQSARRWLENQLIAVYPAADVQIHISPLHTFR